MIKAILVLGRVVAGIFLIVSGFGLFAGSFAFWPVFLGTVGMSAVGGIVLIFAGTSLLQENFKKEKTDAKDEIILKVVVAHQKISTQEKPQIYC